MRTIINEECPWLILAGKDLERTMTCNHCGTTKYFKASETFEALAIMEVFISYHKLFCNNEHN